MRARPSSSLAAQVLTQAAAPQPVPAAGVADAPARRAATPLSRRERRAAARGRAGAGATGAGSPDTAIPATVPAAQPGIHSGLAPRNVPQPRQYSMRRH